MKRKKTQKTLTNEHLLKGQENNFALAEAAIKIAREQIDLDHEFSLEEVLNAVAKNSESKTIEELDDQVKEEK